MFNQDADSIYYAIYNLPISSSSPLQSNPHVHHRRSQTFFLASKCIRSRVLVRRRNRVVDVDQDTWVASRVRTRESNEVLGRRAASTSDLELSAGKIELSSAFALCDVETDVLVAHEVFAGRDATGNSDVVV